MNLTYIVLMLLNHFVMNVLPTFEKIILFFEVHSVGFPTAYGHEIKYSNKRKQPFVIKLPEAALLRVLNE